MNKYMEKTDKKELFCRIVLILVGILFIIPIIMFLIAGYTDVLCDKTFWVLNLGYVKTSLLFALNTIIGLIVIGLMGIFL